MNLLLCRKLDFRIPYRLSFQKLVTESIVCLTQCEKYFYLNWGDFLVRHNVTLPWPGTGRRSPPAWPLHPKTRAPPSRSPAHQAFAQLASTRFIRLTGGRRTLKFQMNSYWWRGVKVIYRWHFIDIWLSLREIYIGISIFIDFFLS